MSPAAEPQRFICRCTVPKLDNALLMADRGELPEFGEVLIVPVSYHGHVRTMSFLVTDIHCSDQSDTFVMAEIELAPVSDPS